MVRLQVLGKFAPFLAALCLAAAVSGCATSTPTGFPEMQASGAFVSATLPPESPGVGYVTEKGQVVVWGKAAGMNVGAALGGALGAGIGGAVDYARNRAMLQGRESAVDLRFDAIVAERLRASGVPGANDRTSAVIFVPRAELFVPDESGAFLVCYLEARFGERRKNGWPDTQRQYVQAAGKRPLLGQGEGWTDGDGKALREATNQCFAWLAEAAAADWQGRYASTGRPITMHVPGGDRTRQGYVLFETADFAVVAGGTAEAPIRSHLSVVGRGTLGR